MSDYLKFKVTGYAYVPVEIAIEVEARSFEHAKAVAFDAWQVSQRRREFIVAGSADDGSVHSFSPVTAVIA